MDRKFALARETTVRSEQELLAWDEELLERQEKQVAPGKRSRTQGGARSRRARKQSRVPGKVAMSTRAAADFGSIPVFSVPGRTAAARQVSGRVSAPVMRKATSTSVSAAPGKTRAGTVDLKSLLDLLASSQGSPLPRLLAERLSALVGHDVSRARVHRDAAAARAAEALDAKAFTVGDDIFFGQGNYAPDSAEGQRLLVHELVHVKQHDQGRLPTGAPAPGEAISVSQPSQPAEREADRVASQVMAPSAAPSAAGPAARPAAPAPTRAGASAASLASAGAVIHRDAATTSSDTPTEEEQPAKITLRLQNSSTDVEIQPPLAGSHTVDVSGLQHPGVRVERAEVTMSEQGALTRGAATVSVDAEGAITADAAQHPITATSPTAGTISTEIATARSSLGEFINGISVNARMIEGGVEAEITISAGTLYGVDVSGGSITARYVNGTLTASGEIGLSALGGKLTGSVAVAWENGDWAITGTATVSDLLPELQPFDLEVSITNGQLVMRAAGIEYSRTIGAISFTGSLDEVSWDQATGAFAGTARLDLDLGSFGAAVANATIANNQLETATVDYTSPELRYPAEGDPVLSGQLDASFLLQNNELSATFNGTANLELGQVIGQGVSNAALAVDAAFDSEGRFSGTIGTTEPLHIGSHFAINGMTLALSPEGQLSGDFVMEVVEVPFLQGATINGSFGEAGLQIDGDLTLASSSVAGVDITGGTIGISYAGGSFTGQGQIQLSAAEGKLTGEIETSYDGQSWTIHGTGQVQDLIPNLQPFDVEIAYAGDQLTITANGVEYQQELGAVSFTGTVDTLSWAQETGGFTGSFGLNIDLGVFGQAQASAAIDNSALSEVTVDYTQPEFRYPRDSESPALSGALQGSFTYTQEGLSGTVSGTASLALGQMAAGVSNLSLQVDAALATTGTWSGTIAGTERLTIGEHFAIDGMSLSLSPEGAISGDFALQVIDVPFLENASLEGRFGEQGLELGGALTLSTSDIAGVEITGGSVNLEYAGGAITGSGQIQISAGEGKLTGTIDVGYDGEVWTINGTGQISELIPGLEPFDVAIAYENSELTVSATGVQFSQTVGAVSFTGTIESLTWANGGLSGNVALEVDLGLFGKADATATIADSALSEAVVNYSQPEFRYPLEGDPVLSGSVQGSLTYTPEGITGTITGTASMNLGAMGADASSLGLAVNAELGADGTYSGTIATTERLTVGQHFAVDGLTLTISPEGALSGDFALQVMDVPFLENASVQGSFGEQGLELGGDLTLAPGSVGGVEITGGSIRLDYAAGSITGNGTIDISAGEGKLTGTVNASYDGQAWTIDGTGQVRDLIPNLEPFDVAIAYENEQITITATGVEFSQTVGSVSIRGTVESLTWDQAAGGFSGSLALDLDLGLFGTAEASATISDNAVSEIVVEYSQPEFRYPQDSPALTGSVQGTLTYTPEGLSGTISGTASLALGEVADASNLSLEVNATLGSDGTWSGTIASTEPLSIGAHFTLDAVSLAITPEGTVSGSFALQVVNVPFLESASAQGTFDESGVSLASELDVSGGSVGGVEITGGTINLNYAGGSITGGGNLSVSAADGKLNGTIDASYDGQSWTIDGAGTVSDLIPGLEPFNVAISYENEQISITAENIQFENQVGAITLAGTIDRLEWDQATGSFTGSFELDVDLALFGAAKARATIANNTLSDATVEYTTPELRYPKDSDAPALSGTVAGTFTYSQEGISGSITGSANVAIGGASEAPGLALEVNAELHTDGTYSGTIASTERVEIGNHFAMNGATLTLAADGSVSGSVEIEVINVPFLESATLTGTFDENGLSIDGTIDVAGGSMAGVEITGGSIAVSYAGGVITGSGTIEISALEGKLSGSVTVGYDGESWTVSGTAQVQDLIPNLDPFDVSVSYANDQLVIEATNVAYTQELGAITITGTVESLRWDQAAGSFSGNVALELDLGLFGAGRASATIADNRVSEWTVEYTTPELRYPKDSESPVFAGQISGSLSFENEQLSGTFSGTANLAMPELMGAQVSNLGLQVDAQLGADGNYSGTIATTERLQIGDYFAIPGISATLEPDGSLSGEFSVEVMNLPYLENASITCAIDDSGVRVVSASATASFGDEGSRAWGTITLSYAEGDGFILDGDVNIKLSEGMVAQGEIRYTTATNEVTATLSMDPIDLLSLAGEERTLLEFDKQVIIFTLYQIVGLYLDVGFTLAFNYDLNLSMEPTVTLAGLSLEDWSFDEASAEVGFLGALAARLTATPQLGVGAFAGHPKIVRGGGGVGVPIVAEAALTPQANFGLRFAPGGGVDGDATLGLVLSFEIKGSVVPYAEFVVLDGMFQHTWQGDSLADFEILPKRELLNYTIDFNNLGDEPEAPTLPSSLEAPGENSASTVWEQDAGQASQTQASGTPDAAAAGQGAQEQAANDASGLGIGSLVSGLLGGGSLGGLRDVLDSVAGTWEQLQQNFEAFRSFVNNWFSTSGANVQTLMQRLREEGFFGLVKSYLRQQLGDDVYYIFEPLLEAGGNVEQQLVELLSQPLSSFNFDTMLRVVSGLLGIAWDSIPALVSAIGTVLGRARQAGERLIGGMVSQGKIGVKRHGYQVFWHHFLAADEYKIRLMGVNTHHRGGAILIDPRNAVAGGLWTALRGISSIAPTNTAVHQRSGEPYYDYWV